MIKRCVVEHHLELYTLLWREPRQSRQKSGYQWVFWDFQVTYKNDFSSSKRSHIKYQFSCVLFTAVVFKSQLLLFVSLTQCRLSPNTLAPNPQTPFPNALTGLQYAAVYHVHTTIFVSPYTSDFSHQCITCLESSTAFAFYCSHHASFVSCRCVCTLCLSER